MVVARLSGQPETPRFLHAAVGDLQRIGHIGVSLFHDPGLQWRAAPGWCREMADTPLRPAFKQSPCQRGGCRPEAWQSADAGADAGKTFTLRKRFPPSAQALRPPCPAKGGKSGSTRLVRRLPGSDAPILQNATMPYDSPRDLPDNVRNVLPAHAQDIYLSACNNAWDTYADPDDRRGDDSREEVAHKVAWTAVKQRYSKQADGRWRASD